LARVRVRGIAATALTKILMDLGHTIVQASRIIQDRFNLVPNYAPADATVKDAGQDELLVIGFPKEAEEVVKNLVDVLEDVFVWKSKLNLYSTVTAKVVDKKEDICILELPYGFRSSLSGCSNDVGDIVTVSVIKAPIKPGEEPRVSRNIRVIGEYVMLIHGSPKLTASEHIRNGNKRKELLATAAASVMGKGLGVHLRSSAAYASPDDIIREIGILEEKLKEIIEESRKVSEPRVIYEGELVALIGLTSRAKEVLDEYRSKVVPTIMGHHSYKTYGNTLSELTDFAELLISKGVDKKIVEESIREHILSRISNNKNISIIHVKPDGSVLKLTPGRLESIIETDNGLKLRIKRVFKGKGVYDALGVEKKPGDYDEMIVETNKWYVIHNYYRANGEQIGVYVNINTPPEILPDQIKYHDLAVDVVKLPGEKPKVTDMEEFKKYCEEGIISMKLCKKVESIINDVTKMLE